MKKQKEKDEEVDLLLGKLKNGDFNSTWLKMKIGKEGGIEKLSFEKEVSLKPEKDKTK